MIAGRGRADQPGQAHSAARPTWSRRRSSTARAARRADHRHRRRARRLHRGHLGGRAHRHHRRHRRQPRQVRRRRPAGADPRAARRERARRRGSCWSRSRWRPRAGAAVPLSAVARFELGQGPTAIDRYDRMRRVVIGADLVGDVPLGEAVERGAWRCRRPRTCRRASRSSSSATPRSWARCSRASPRPWAPAS